MEDGSHLLPDVLSVESLYMVFLDLDRPASENYRRVKEDQKDLMVGIFVLVV